MALRKFFVGGNWKCNGSSAANNQLVELLNATETPENVEVVVSPPFVFLQSVRQTLRPDYAISAQNCHQEAKGAFTGEVSAEMLQDIGVPFVILGHSERRNIYGETDQLIAQKVQHAQKAGLSIIACVGERLEERESGSTNDVVLGQIRAIAGAVVDWSKIVIAYEPVWAIGTGRVATTEQAQEVHATIREWLAK
eukprot:CAMPEP_0184339726 /NCGR_PEP_ID=MMETSP1089-20130417/8407_1 /TAXON_ID=38269 ORGANISM="Gloeochaete wittrockiana, Strain SAG46.84" /NCGR_SAMPLE_ID=MMETSP1089 /ASSEMBLY_ACC=CAM_ASM_000445 /LENGTH=194 /DNA_ID=CAMNT_0026667139 /DNA_START=56 /DNA_END=637 /DNA_ORIENTATION=-